MGTTWTNEQKDVIEFRDCNILVSAAAGSGKTAVLVERILSMLMDPEHPADIDRMLIVTFTNAAAGEMKERIRLSIDKTLEEKEDELDEEMEEHLQKQISLLGNAQISTIHSFCQYVIRNYFHVIDLDPGFRVMDEGENKLLLADVVEQVLEEAYEKADPDFLAMTESIATGKDDFGLEDMVLRLYHFAQSFEDPAGWLEERKHDFEVAGEEEFLALPWVKLMAVQCRETLADVENMIERTLAITQMTGGPYMYESMIQEDLEAVRKIREATDYLALGEAFARKPKETALSKKKDDAVSEEKREQVKNLRAGYKKTLKDLQESYFYASVEEIIAQMGRQKSVIDELAKVTITLLTRFEEEKRKKNLCDFNDLEHLALRILDDENVAADLAERFDQIMIDEYQDSNMVQEILLKKVSREKQNIFNMFMVGDVKQSIYRFRLARPELFMEKYDTYSTTEGNCRRIDLHKNFRSRSQVLDSVNDIFNRIMRKNLGGVEYDEAARLNVGASFAEDGTEEDSYKTEIMILDLPKEEMEDEEASARELEARMIGQEILRLVKEQKILDKATGAYRLAEFSDIVILLRSMTGWSETFMQVLNDMGIPVFAGSRSGYFTAPEIQTILAFLRVIDNPCQDIPLTAVLYSPIAKLSGQDLAMLKTEDKEKPFHQVCMESERLKEFFTMLEEFRTMSVYMPVHELIRLIYDRTGFYRYEASLPGGEQRAANLDMLIDKAAAYEKGSYHGLYNFVRYIDNLKKYEIDLGEADTLLGETNMVKIMSIHKSKGLEFPIVFTAGMGKMMNQMDANAPLILHADYGIAMDEVDPVMRTKQKSLMRNVLKDQIKNDNLGEEMRVLYVAMTRAKEKLILTGTIKNADEKIGKYYESITGPVMSFSDRSSARTYFDWVVPVVLQMGESGSIRMSMRSRKDLVEEEKERITSYFENREYWDQLSAAEVQDEKVRETLQAHLEYQYPYGNSIRIPSKVSVSELKAQSYREVEQEAHVLYTPAEPEAVIPEFLKTEHLLTGAGKGTIYHKMMECMDFGKTPEEELLRLQNQGIFTEEEAKIIEPDKIRAFLSCDLGKRMALAQKRGELFREQQFVLQEKADKIHPEWDSDEMVLIQGIIDAFFFEDDEIVLLDYKTDKVFLQDASSLYDKYRVQLNYYKKALERLTGRRVKESMIYSFFLNRVVTESEEQ